MRYDAFSDISSKYAVNVRFSVAVWMYGLSFDTNVLPLYHPINSQLVFGVALYVTTVPLLTVTEVEFSTVALPCVEPSTEEVNVTCGKAGTGKFIFKVWENL